jgi:2-polyprenyl-6-methoxyphenol hydroxylase-like FAD-dependent oxidoreductase
VGRRALIIGGGIGGMSCAVSLAKIGWEIDLVEVDRDWRALGAGLTIGGAALRAFRSLGLLEDIRRSGYLATHHTVMLRDGTVLADGPMPWIDDEISSLGGILRPALHEILAGHVRRAGSRVRLGVTFRSLEIEGRKVRAVTDDGETANYDLVLGADGLASSTRHAVFPEASEPTFTGQGCWRLVAPRPPEQRGPIVYAGGPYPTGLNPISEASMYMYMLTPDPDQRYIAPQAQLDELRSLLKPFAGVAGEIAAKMDASYLVNYRPLQQFFLEGPWYKGPVLLIGDAAHATTPHVGFGAGLAVEDAVVLAEELDGESDVTAALARHFARRTDRARFVVETSVRLGELELAQRFEERSQLANKATQRLLEPI